MTDNLHFFTWEVPLKAERPKVKAVKVIEALPMETPWEQLISALQQEWASEAPLEVYNRAMEVLGSQSNATGWLTRKLMPLEGKTPVDACRTREGRQQVLNILGRIEHGIFS